MDVSMNATADIKAGKGCKRTSGFKDTPVNINSCKWTKLPKAALPKRTAIIASTAVYNLLHVKKLYYKEAAILGHP